MMWKIPLFDLDYGEAESKALLEVLNDKWLSAGPKTKAFEANFAAHLGKDIHACAVTNCTAALSMALQLSNIGKGDEVIISSMSFIASLNVTKLVGATPILADSISLTDWNLNLEEVEKKITAKTKAVIAVHFAGYPVQIEALSNLCKKHNLILIEDVAHAVGGSVKGQQCGTFGDFGCFSFFSNKNLSTGEGGMLVSKDPEMDKAARLLRSHGMTSMTIDRHEGRTISYDVVAPGFNYRTDEIKSALGLVQLAKLDKNNGLRKEKVAIYRTELAKIDGVIVPFQAEPKGDDSSYHIMPVLLPKGADRITVVEKLKGSGIQTSLHYPSYNQFSAYKEELTPQAVPVADEIASRVVTLPLYPIMKDEDILTICKELAKALA